jgi:hypothetical protein
MTLPFSVLESRTLPRMTDAFKMLLAWQSATDSCSEGQQVMSIRIWQSNLFMESFTLQQVSEGPRCSLWVIRRKQSISTPSSNATPVMANWLYYRSWTLTIRSSSNSVSVNLYSWCVDSTTTNTARNLSPLTLTSRRLHAASAVYSHMTHQHGAISQNSVISINSTMKTSNYKKVNYYCNSCCYSSPQSPV